jgi:parallel beta-helix repeat protein
MRNRKMIRWIIIGIVILSFGASMVPAGLSIQSEKKNAGTLSNTWIVDNEGDGDFVTIQAAIDAASAGDIINVYSGVYHESVNINKSLQLIGKDTEYLTGSDTGKPEIYGTGLDNTISVYTNNQEYPIKISGFIITHSGNHHAGVYLEYSKSVEISYNIITMNHHGFQLYYSETDHISENDISDNDYAAIIEFSNYCTISMNNFVNNTHGIQLSVSLSNSITQNEIKGTTDDYGLLFLRSYINQVTFNNFIQNKKQASFQNSVNTWHDNYWSNKVGAMPLYIIWGIFQANIFPALKIPWPQFDLRPAASPN